MSRLPLIQAYQAGANLALSSAGWIDQQGFLASVQRLAGSLPEAPLVINLCESRDTFLIGFAAALLRGQTTVLPPDRTAETLERLCAQYPASHVLRDAQVLGAQNPAPREGSMPTTTVSAGIPGDQLATLAFTSGSTGAPAPHARTWASLCARARAFVDRLDLGGASIVATVPPQHTFGFEATIMTALAGTSAMHCGRPLFPHDVCTALAAVPAPRVLVTTPIHIKALVQSRLAMPPLRTIISATAHLDAELAAAAEEVFETQVREVYGSTESGALATRRTVEGEMWTPLPGISLIESEGGALAQTTQQSAALPLADAMDIAGDGRFRLLGRSSDLLKIAGKRASLMELNRKLLAIPGVEDGVLFLPESGTSGLEVRLAALVVAPGLNRAEILAALARSVDPVFLPRPLRVVPKLPRNELGKLPLAALRGLLQS